MCRALIDTGATLSLLSLDAWNDYCRSRQQSPRLKPLPTGMILTSLTGDMLRCHGIGEVFVLGKTVSFYVISNLGNHDMIVGDDILRLMKSTIKRDKNLVILNGQKFYSKRLSVFDTKFCSVSSNFDYWYSLFPDLFVTSGPLPVTPSFECDIDTGDAAPFHERQYRLPLSKRKLLDQEVDRMLAEGVIVPSASPYASPICLVPKGGQSGFASTLESSMLKQ